MALRSLVGKLRVPPSAVAAPRSFTHKGKLCKSSARLTDPTKYGLVDDKFESKRRYDKLLHEYIMHSREKTRKQMRADNRMVALISIVHTFILVRVGYRMGYRASNA